jgi:hypothetical protein
MSLRTGIYIVPTDRWYIERMVWLIAGMVLLVASTAMALLMNPLWVLLGVTATGLVSINVAFTGFCPVGSISSGASIMRWESTFPSRPRWSCMQPPDDSFCDLCGRCHGVVCRDGSMSGVCLAGHSIRMANADGRRIEFRG